MTQDRIIPSSQNQTINQLSQKLIFNGKQK